MSELQELLANNHALAWAVLGVLLLIAEVMAVGGFFLSFSAAAFLVAGAAGLSLLPEDSLWQAVIFAALGVSLILPLRRLIRRYLDQTPDINRY
ncbi:MAG: hypothetical protein FJ164_06220 [Gammaproteobacteria bacterium]|nr:hypothetical protein [Gammaproteobacteria bacterium]